MLTESRVPTISKVTGRARGFAMNEMKEGPIPRDLLMQILYFLFPDADFENVSLVEMIDCVGFIFQDH